MENIFEIARFLESRLSKFRRAHAAVTHAQEVVNNPDNGLGFYGVLERGNPQFVDVQYILAPTTNIQDPTEVNAFLELLRTKNAEIGLKNVDFTYQGASRDTNNNDMFYPGFNDYVDQNPQVNQGIVRTSFIVFHNPKVAILYKECNDFQAKNPRKYIEGLGFLESGYSVTFVDKLLNDIKNTKVSGEATLAKQIQAYLETNASEHPAGGGGSIF